MSRESICFTKDNQHAGHSGIVDIYIIYICPHVLTRRDCFNMHNNYRLSVALRQVLIDLWIFNLANGEYFLFDCWDNKTVLLSAKGKHWKQSPENSREQRIFASDVEMYVSFTSLLKLSLNWRIKGIASRTSVASWLQSNSRPCRESKLTMISLRQNFLKYHTVFNHTTIIYVLKMTLGFRKYELFKLKLWLQCDLDRQPLNH